MLFLMASPRVIRSPTGQIWDHRGFLAPPNLPILMVASVTLRWVGAEPLVQPIHSRRIYRFYTAAAATQLEWDRISRLGEPEPVWGKSRTARISTLQDNERGEKL